MLLRLLLLLLLRMLRVSIVIDFVGLGVGIGIGIGIRQALGCLVTGRLAVGCRPAPRRGSVQCEIKS